MARLRTIGFEIGLGVSALEGSQSTGGTATATLDATTKRSGATSLKCTSDGSGNAASTTIGFTGATAVTYFARVYARLTALPASGSVAIVSLGPTLLLVRLTSGGLLQLWNSATNTQIGADSLSALALNTWYRIEVAVAVNTSTNDDYAELLLDGASVASSTTADLGINPPGTIACGWVAVPAPASASIYLDDFALNDSTGASQNSWPGEGKIVALRPTSDNAVGTGWVDGDGAGTLFGSVDNSPPAGAATPADGTQIKNLTSTTTGNYDATMTTYTAAGIAAGDTITLAQALCDHGEDIATGTKLGALQIVSNPAQAGEDGFTYGDDLGADGAWPAFWATAWGTAQIAPSVTLGTAPVLRVGKRTATTREVHVDAMAIMVEYVLAAGPSPFPPWPPHTLPLVRM